MIARAPAVVALVPLYPGDLLASRTALRVLARQLPLTLVVREQLSPLVAGIGGRALTYDLPWPFDPASLAFQRRLRHVEIPEQSLVIDFIGMAASMEAIRRWGIGSIGHSISAEEPTPYTVKVPWSLDGTPDRTHFAVRMLRLVPGYSEATEWPRGLFERARFPVTVAGYGTVALAPGCGRAGNDKRMPVPFWRELAAWLRGSGFDLIWFLGPDEMELSPLLVEEGDEQEGGDWDAVIRSHVRCGLGITHDTCHMHLRAHLAALTLAVFRRDDVAVWGAYPKYVGCIGPEDSLDAVRTVEIVKQWVRERVESDGLPAVSSDEITRIRSSESNDRSEVGIHAN